jgi:hypothetical protein
MKYCPECGEKIEDVRKYCPECGFRFLAPVVPIPETSKPVQPIESNPIGELEKKTVKKRQKEKHVWNRKQKVALVFGIIIITVIILIIGSQLVNRPQPYYYSPTWRTIDTFELMNGDSHNLFFIGQQWRISWTQVSGEYLEAILYSNDDGSVFDTIYSTYDTQQQKTYTADFNGYIKVDSEGEYMFTIEAHS